MSGIPTSAGISSAESCSTVSKMGLSKVATLRWKFGQIQLLQPFWVWKKKTRDILHDVDLWWSPMNILTKIGYLYLEAALVVGSTLRRSLDRARIAVHRKGDEHSILPCSTWEDDLMVGQQVNYETFLVFSEGLVMMFDSAAGLSTSQPQRLGVSRVYFSGLGTLPFILAIVSASAVAHQGKGSQVLPEVKPELWQHSFKMTVLSRCIIIILSSTNWKHKKFYEAVGCPHHRQKMSTPHSHFCLSFNILQGQADQSTISNLLNEDLEVDLFDVQSHQMEPFAQ